VRVSATAVAYATNAGAKLHYEVYGDGAETIVLIPGLGLRGAVWDPVTRLLEESYRVVVVEPRGSGDSATPDEPYTAELVAADLKAVLDDSGVDAGHLVGLSMGGMIAQDFVLAFPDRVNSLVLLSTFASPDQWFTRLFRFRKDLIHRMGILEHFRIYLMFVFSPFAFRNIPDVIARIETSLQQRPPDTEAYLRQIDYCLEHDVTPALSRVQVPTLVITGSHDFLTPVPLGKELAEAIPGAEYREFELASHGLWLEYSKELADACDEFIQRSRAEAGGRREKTWS
jgi:3-oxoadipate enol-lactonase